MDEWERQYNAESERYDRALRYSEKGYGIRGREAHEEAQARQAEKSAVKRDARLRRQLAKKDAAQQRKLLDRQEKAMRKAQQEAALRAQEAKRRAIAQLEAGAGESAVEHVQGGTQTQASSRATAQPAQLPGQDFDPFESGALVSLTDKARAGLLDEVIGREDEVRSVIEVLGQLNTPNAILTGRGGVGKTAIAEGLAYKIIDGEAVNLADYEVYSLDFAALRGGGRFTGDQEERTKLVLKAICKPNVITFIDEAHHFFSEPLLSNTFKPSLNNGDMRAVLASTADEWQEIADKDPALASRFTAVDIAELTGDDAVDVLLYQAEEMERHHKVSISGDVVRGTIRLTDTYMANQAQVRKSIAVLDAAASRTSIEGDDVVTIETVAAVISDRTGISTTQLLASRSERVENLEEELRKAIKGQDAALEVVTKAVRSKLRGSRTTGKPDVLLFRGPTGVGKTGLANAIAEFRAPGNKRAHLHINMSGYRKPEDIWRLMGSPPGYQSHSRGGELLNGVLAGAQVITLDEFEKAHHDIQMEFLPIFDGEVIRSPKGQEVNFANTIIIMTTNFYDEGAAKQHFLNEVWGRITAQAEFVPLSQSAIIDITDGLLRNLEEQFYTPDELSVCFAPEYVSEIASQYESQIGVRSLERVVNKLGDKVESKIMRALERGDIERGDTVTIPYVSSRQ